MLDALRLDPIAFTIPVGDGFAVYWYGIIITIGIAIGAIWGGREIERRGQNPDEFFNGLLLAVLSGYLFARLTYVILDVLGGNGARYDSLFSVINIRAGGVNILGGFVGAALVIWLFASWRKLNLWHYADVAGMVILVAQAIGRWGNFINQELYGPPTELPWGILIDRGFRLGEFATLPPETRFHPTFLYESVLLLIGFFVLLWLNGRNRDTWQPGTLFSYFMIWWGVQRFFIEFFRPDQTTLGDSPITYSMLISIAIALFGAYLLMRRTGRVSTGKKKRVAKPKVRRSS